MSWFIPFSKLKRSPKQDLEMLSGGGGGGGGLGGSGQQTSRHSAALIVKSSSRLASIAWNPANARIQIHQNDSSTAAVKVDVTDGIRIPASDDQSTPAVLDLLVATAEQMLVQTFTFAAVRSRRDDLWERLVKGQSLTLRELGELLSLVHIEKLDAVNECLKQLSKSFSSRRDFVPCLLQALQAAYPAPNQHRICSSEDGMIKHVMVQHKSGQCCVVVVLDQRTGKTTVSLIYKDAAFVASSLAEGGGEVRSIQIAQDFVNDICYQMWKKLF